MSTRLVQFFDENFINDLCLILSLLYYSTHMWWKIKFTSGQDSRSVNKMVDSLSGNYIKDGIAYVIHLISNRIASAYELGVIDEYFKNRMHVSYYN